MRGSWRAAVAVGFGLMSVLPAAGTTHGMGRTVRDALARYEPETRREMGPACRAARIAWPPRRVTLVAFKAERRLEVWAGGRSGPLRHVATYAILAASGGPGVKHREGDMQAPEGYYRISQLNPQSRFHLSLRVG